MVPCLPLGSLSEDENKFTIKLRLNLCGKFQGPPANGVNLDRFLMANWAIYVCMYVFIKNS